jgi:hypothetical protein
MWQRKEGREESLDCWDMPTLVDKRTKEEKQRNMEGDHILYDIWSVLPERIVHEDYNREEQLKLQKRNNRTTTFEFLSASSSTSSYSSSSWIRNLIHQCSNLPLKVKQLLLRLVFSSYSFHPSYLFSMKPHSSPSPSPFSLLPSPSPFSLLPSPFSLLPSPFSLLLVLPLFVANLLIF